MQRRRDLVSSILWYSTVLDFAARGVVHVRTKLRKDNRVRIQYQTFDGDFPVTSGCAICEYASGVIVVQPGSQTPGHKRVKEWASSARAIVADRPVSLEAVLDVEAKRGQGWLKR